MTTSDPASREMRPFLNLLCIPVGDAWRVFTAPTWMPDYLRRCFSDSGEIYPVYLDFEDLDRVTKKRGLPIDRTTNPDGYVELIARGDGARELAIWLANAFSSGFRAEEPAITQTKKPGAAG
jgi:hypothetical protein